MNQSQTITMVLSLAKIAKQTLENDPLSGWGHIVKVYEKHDRFSLDYCPISLHPDAREIRKFNLVRFNSTSYQLYPFVAVVDGASSSQNAVSDFVRKCPPGFKLDN